MSTRKGERKGRKKPGNLVVAIPPKGKMRCPKKFDRKGRERILLHRSGRKEPNMLTQSEKG